MWSRGYFHNGGWDFFCYWLPSREDVASTESFDAEYNKARAESNIQPCVARPMEGHFTWWLVTNRNHYLIRQLVGTQAWPVVKLAWNFAKCHSCLSDCLAETGSCECCCCYYWINFTFLFHLMCSFYTDILFSFCSMANSSFYTIWLFS